MNAQKMNFSVKNLFSKWEHLFSNYLLNKSLTENFIFCVVNIIGFNYWVLLQVFLQT